MNANRLVRLARVVPLVRVVGSVRPERGRARRRSRPWRRDSGLRRGRSAIALIALAPSACLVYGFDSVSAAVVRDRLREVEVGDTLEQAHARLRRDPVRKPGHPGDPFPTPLHVVQLQTPDGRRVRLETYVVAARRAEGCPDFHYEDVPVVYVDGIVAGMTWEFVEWRWRDWGGELGRLRALQDRYRCSEPEAPERGQ